MAVNPFGTLLEISAIEEIDAIVTVQLSMSQRPCRCAAGTLCVWHDLQRTLANHKHDLDKARDAAEKALGITGP